MGLIIFHLIFSSFTHDGVDMGMAEKIITYNIKRYPNGDYPLCCVSSPRTQPLPPGVFFLFAQGRLNLCRSQPTEAIGYYKRAMEVQDQYRNLHHISYWEMCISNLALWDLRASLNCWRKLKEEATVSRLQGLRNRGSLSSVTVVEGDIHVRVGYMSVGPR